MSWLLRAHPARHRLHNPDWHIDCSVLLLIDLAEDGTWHTGFQAREAHSANHSLHLWLHVCFSRPIWLTLRFKWRRITCFSLVLYYHSYTQLLRLDPYLLRLIHPYAELQSGKVRQPLLCVISVIGHRKYQLALRIIGGRRRHTWRNIAARWRLTELIFAKNHAHLSQPGIDWPKDSLLDARLGAGRLLITK